MNYVDSPKAYDVVKIAGQTLPGEVSFGEVKRELSKKHKRGSGNDGAEPTYGGLKPTSLTIKCVLHTAEDEEAWIKIAPLMMSITHPERRNQVAIEHPQFARMGITRCAVHAISENQPKGKPLEVSISIDSVAVKTGATHKPKQTTAGGNVVSRIGRIADSRRSATGAHTDRAAAKPPRQRDPDRYQPRPVRLSRCCAG